MTTPQTTPQACAATAAVQVPAQVPDRKCWAKAVSGVDTAQAGGYALQGPFLDRGATYRLPTGLLVVTCERLKQTGRDGDRYTATVTLWRADPVTDGGLALVKTWTKKRGRIGPQIIKGIASRLAKDDPPRASTAGYRPHVAAPRRRNQRWDSCRHCKQEVPPGSGFLVHQTSRSTGRGYTLVEHTVCPPRPNDFPGRCMDCLGWMKAREGILAVDPATGRWRPRHEPHCPDVPAPPPQRQEPLLNRWPGPCEVCWQWIPAGKGELIGPQGDRHVVHRGEQCPPNPYNPDREPTWILDEIATAAYDYPPGTVARVSLPDGPADGPGWRPPQGTATEVSVIGVVITAVDRTVRDLLGRGTDRTVTVWRVATPAEAAPVLDGEAARMERAGLTARARRLLALLPGAAPADATAPPEHDLLDADLAALPHIPVPLGAARPETSIAVDEPGQTVWTIVHNRGDGDDWTASNWGGSIAYRHPLTPDRAELLQDLRAHHR